MIPHVNGYKGDLEEDNIPFAIDNVKNLKWYDRILLNRPIRVIFLLLLLAILAPLLIYRYFFFPTLELPPPDGLSGGSCLVAREARLPCGIEAVTPDKCHEQCCYDHHSNLCYHRYPSRFSYLFPGRWSEQANLNPRQTIVPYASQTSFTNVRLSVDEVTATHLTFTFYRDDNIIGRRLPETKYSYSITNPNSNPHVGTELNIIVNSTQGNIFNTALGPLIASENIWEITFRLTNETMYGLGEIPLKAGTVKVIYSHRGESNSIPLIFAKYNGSYHGLLIEAMAATEVIVRPDNQLVLRSITNLGLKFHLFVGPKPVDVMKDVMLALGMKKSLDYWMLGAHICREKTSDDPLEELRAFISTSNTERMPFESHCGTVPIVFQTECNTTKVNLVDQGAIQIRNARKKFVPHVSPYIKYTPPPKPEESEETTEATRETETNERCFDDDKFDHFNIRDPGSMHLYKGKVDNHDVIYPGYLRVSEEFMHSLWVYDKEFDAVVLENSWPLDESDKTLDGFYDIFPYFNEHFEAAFNITPQWNATRPTRPVSRNTRITNATEFPGEKYLLKHNEYGNQFANAFVKIKGPVPTLSTSQWMNGNVTINRQSIPTLWSSLQRELVEASLGGISGHWHWSSPICGDTEHFDNTTQIRLCAKWYMAATYMPMIKIHSKVVARDPLAFVGNDRALMIKALNRRLSLLPYINTVLQDGPLLRPMFYQYPESERLTDLTSQFAVGDDLLIVPNLLPSQTHVHTWMPPGTWYEFWGGLKIDGEEGEAVTMTTTEADFFTLVRAGSIIIMQKNPQLSADLTRLQSPYSLVIALECETKISTETFDPTTVTEPATTTMVDEEDNPSEGTTTADEDSISTDTTVDATTTDNTDNEEITTTDTPIRTVTTCDATGKLYMNEEMTIVFHANATSLTITAKGEGFQQFCDPNVATWSGIIRELSIYGLDKKENNYDDQKVITMDINLCQLVRNEEIVYEFVD